MPARRQRGVTLAELTVTCAVLAVAAALALPAAQPAVEARFDAAAGEVVQALRFAREEAMRTGAYRAMRCDTANNRVLVYVPGATATISATGAAVNHPLSKMDYTINLGQAPAGGNVKLTGCSFAYTGDGSTLLVAFDGNGNPMGGNTKIAALTGGAVVLGIGNATRTVAIDVAGRVTVS